MGREHAGADVHGVDTVVRAPQLALAHMRPCEGHGGKHPRHVHENACRLPLRAVGRRRAAAVPPVRALHQRAGDSRPGMPRDHRVGGEPGSGARSRLQHGPPERDGFLAGDAAQFARRLHTRRVRRHSLNPGLADSDGEHGQRRGLVFPLRMAALQGRRRRQARRVRGVARNRDLPPAASRPRGAGSVDERLRTHAVGRGDCASTRYTGTAASARSMPTRRR